MDNDAKYIELLTSLCMNGDKKGLFLSYQKEITPFILKLKEKVYSMGIYDIYEEVIDPYELHDILKDISVENMRTHPYFNKEIWDEYVKKDANFMMFVTEYPHLMDDIDCKKLAEMARISQETKPLYREKQRLCEVFWSIAAYPGKSWASNIYATDDNYEKLKEAIFRVCMVDTDDPVGQWKRRIEENNKIVDCLNALGIQSLHYTNSLGTDLVVYLPDDYLYESALDNGIMANMPSYEVFASPIYWQTEGIVYASMPLMYQGEIVENFYLRFHQGKVVEVHAEKGEDILKGIVESDSHSCYLGECALVEKDSPIANMNTIFKTTLIDENASCHLALGAGFAECLKQGLSMSSRELLEKGINDSKTHVDFMIGTDDLNIVATLRDESKFPIFEKGKYSKELLDKIR